MKRSLIGLLLVAAIGFQVQANDDVEAVKEAIVKGYVEGIHMNGDPVAIRKGFHKDFTMMIHSKDGLNKMTRDEWIERIEAGAERRKSRPPREVTYKFPSVEVSGHAAVARIEMFINGNHVFTDFMALYRFPEGWKIVNKTFYRHPKKK